MNKIIYLLSLGNVLFTVVATLIADFVLDKTDNPTISDFLRKDPEWFYIPCMVLMVLMLVLTVHLFVQRLLP